MLCDSKAECNINMLLQQQFISFHKHLHPIIVQVYSRHILKSDRALQGTQIIMTLKTYAHTRRHARMGCNFFQLLHRP
jgi:hypothetical protein